ncbi:MAG: InlB B-repeat-containing protein [Lachnospiraceae bacterium]|nr:InlB B-repeat-containing protein [Lachnospiraceae bacterium]
MNRMMKEKAGLFLIAVMVLEMLLPGFSGGVYAETADYCNGEQVADGSVSGFSNWQIFKDDYDIGTQMTPETGMPLYKKEDGSIFAESIMLIDQEPEWTEAAAAAGTLKYPKAGISVYFKDDHSGVSFNTLGIRYIRITAKCEGPIRLKILNKVTDRNAAANVQNVGEGSEPGIYMDNSREYNTVLYDMTPYEFGFKGCGEGKRIDILDWVDKNKAPEGSEILECISGLSWEVKDAKGGLGKVSIKAIEFLDADKNPVSLEEQTLSDKREKFSVVFRGNGGEGTMDSQMFQNGDQPVLKKCGFTRNGYTFTGWNTKADGSGTAYSDGAKLDYPGAEEAEEVILYAQWKKQETQGNDKQNTNPDQSKKTEPGTGEQTKSEPAVKAKTANPLKLKGKTASIKYKKIRKKAQKIAVSKFVSFTAKGQGKLEYNLASAKKGSKNVKKYFKINAETGKLTIKKGLKKGTYKVKIIVKAAGNDAYEPSDELPVTCKVKIN